MDWQKQQPRSPLWSKPTEPSETVVHTLPTKLLETFKGDLRLCSLTAPPRMSSLLRLVWFFFLFPLTYCSTEVLWMFCRTQMVAFLSSGELMVKVISLSLRMLKPWRKVVVNPLRHSLKVGVLSKTYTHSSLFLDLSADMVICAGCFFTSSGGLRSFEFPLNELKPVPRVDSSGQVCGATFKVDSEAKKESAMPRVGSVQNWSQQIWKAKMWF